MSQPGEADRPTPLGPAERWYPPERNDQQVTNGQPELDIHKMNLAVRRILEFERRHYLEDRPTLRTYLRTLAWVVKDIYREAGDTFDLLHCHTEVGVCTIGGAVEPYFGIVPTATLVASEAQNQELRNKVWLIFRDSAAYFFRNNVLPDHIYLLWRPTPHSSAPSEIFGYIGGPDGDERGMDLTALIGGSYQNRIPLRDFLLSFITRWYDVPLPSFTEVGGIDIFYYAPTGDTGEMIWSNTHFNI